jgi:hypothetical protein
MHFVPQKVKNTVSLLFRLSHATGDISAVNGESFLELFCIENVERKEAQNCSVLRI